MTDNAETAAPKVARYVVIVERYIQEGCDSVDGTPVDGMTAVRQLVAELGEGWDRAGIAGWFHVVERTVEDEMVYPNIPTPTVADDPDYPQQQYDAAYWEERARKAEAALLHNDGGEA